MKDDLGTRMKEQYENRTRYFLPRRTYTIMRLDGKAFHTFTKGMERPYDLSLMSMMDETAKFLCENIQGVQFAYTQSDEISLLLTDFEKITTDAWFDNNIQKMVSVAASIATAKFNKLYVRNFIKTSLIERPNAKIIDSNFWDVPGIALAPYIDIDSCNLAFFDARVFIISDVVEVENYFVWRQKDAVRNSIAMTAQSLYSHKELNGKSSSQQQDMIHEKGGNWNEMLDGFKRGRMIRYMTWEGFDDSDRKSVWEIIPAYDFLKDRKDLQVLIPKLF